MISEEEYEIERICAKIINDHLSFKAYPETFTTLSENSEDLDDINFRKQIMTFIKNKESLKALECVKNENLKKLLLKQSFLELIEKNEVDEALRLGNEYLTKYENDDIFAVIGYDSLDNNEIKHLFEEKAAIDLANTINESLFESKKGRSASLLMIAWFHYKSIQSFLNK